MLDFSIAADLTKMPSEQVREYVKKSILDLAHKCNDYNSVTKQDVEDYDSALDETQIYQETEAFLVDRMQNLQDLEPSIIPKIFEDEQ